MKERCRGAAWVTKGRVKERRGNAFVLFCLGDDPPAISRLALMDLGGEYTQFFSAIRMFSGRETEQKQGFTWLRRFLIKGVVFMCVTHLDLNGIYFIFNYSLLVKRTSQPDGYRPDCKCPENVYLKIEEITTTLSLAFHNILWTAGSIVNYQLSMGLWNAMEGFV